MALPTPVVGFETRDRVLVTETRNDGHLSSALPCLGLALVDCTFGKMVLVQSDESIMSRYVIKFITKIVRGISIMKILTGN